MLNLNALYNAVFKPEYRKLDYKNDYFTVILDTPEFSVLHEEFKGRIERLMSPDAYTYLHTAEAPFGQAEIEEHLALISETMDRRTNGMPPPRRYCLMTYFENQQADTTYIAKLISWLGAQNTDVISLFVCIPKAMEQKIEFLEQMAKNLGPWATVVDLYVFTDAITNFYRGELLNSMSAAIIMNASIQDYHQRKSRKTSADYSVQQFLESIGADGVQHVENFTPIRWSSLFCRQYDRQFDFLNQYVATACNNIRTLTKDDFSQILQNVYDDIMPEIPLNTVRATANRAMSYIPYVIPPDSKITLSTLGYYFDHIYGGGNAGMGVATVDLTLKATLAGIYDYRIETRAKQCAELIFEKCADFASDDLYKLLVSMLEQQVVATRKLCNIDTKKYLDNDMFAESKDSIIDEYLDQYIKLYVRQKELALWEEVLRVVRAHPKDFEGICQKSVDYFRQLEDLKNSLPSTPLDAYEIHFDHSYSAGELLSLEKDSESCAQIRSLYERARSESANVVHPSNCGMVFNVPVAPQFYKGYTVRMDTPTYTLAGYEINGKYFISKEGAQDV